jgi:hypothetical protein
MNESPTQDANMNLDELYLEEVFTDQKIGTIRRMTPVDSNGQPDSSRKTSFYGQAQMMTPAGPMPLNFELEANNLSEACAVFAEAAKVALERTIEELKEMRRQQASSIVVPGQEPGMGGLGGLPGGGKIQL